MTELNPGAPAPPPAAPRCESARWSRLVGGLSVLAVGVIFWLDRMGRIEARDYLRWWPVVLLGYALANLIQRRWAAAAILALLGLVFLPSLPFFPYVNLARILGVWPVLISVAGVTLILQAIRPAAKDSRNAGDFRAMSFMGGSSRSIDSEVFRGGDAYAVMGACVVRVNSPRAVEGATIDVLAFWGGVEIRVPRGWRVVDQVTPVLGGFNDRTAATSIPDAPTIVVRGAAIMGGIEVRNPKEVTL